MRSIPRSMRFELGPAVVNTATGVGPAVSNILASDVGIAVGAAEGEGATTALGRVGAVSTAVGDAVGDAVNSAVGIVVRGDVG